MSRTGDQDLYGEIARLRRELERVRPALRDALALVNSNADDADRLEAELDEERFETKKQRVRAEIAEAAADDEHARLGKALAMMRRLRSWDVIAGSPGHESTADAPYWRGEIDRCLAEIETSS